MFWVFPELANKCVSFSGAEDNTEKEESGKRMGFQLQAYSPFFQNQGAESLTEDKIWFQGFAV